MKHQDQTIPKGWYSKDGYHWCDNGGPSIDISTGDAVVLVITRKVDDGRV